MRDLRLGRHLKLGDLCECTDTYRTFADSVDPLPKNQKSLEALELLTSRLLDPIIDHFGSDRFKLTYGFCSDDLRRKLVSKNPETGKPYGRVAPKLDQHVAAETLSDGLPICARGGAAVDFRIIGCGSRDVALWIINEGLPFDRLYFYGDDRSIHLSHGPENSRYICAFSEKGLPEKKSIQDLVTRAREVYGR